MCFNTDVYLLRDSLSKRNGMQYLGCKISFFLVKNIVGSDNHPFIVNSTSFHVVFLFCIKANGLLVELSMNFVRMLSW